jgi:cell division transport system permease protein
MKSIRNHLSLVIALLSILFSVQVFTIVERSIDAYKENLATQYSLVVVSKKRLESSSLMKRNNIIADISTLSADSVIKKLNTGMSSKNIELLKLTLPKFYKVKLKHYPTPSEVNRLTKNIQKLPNVMKVENFSHNHDSTYKLLLLFKNVISIFALSMIVVTVLLIFKELKIWQFKHNERMNIMGLFGAPTWMRSAVLFRLSIVDAIIASALSFVLFSYVAADEWIEEQFAYIGIDIVIFDPLFDFLSLLAIAITVSIVLASLIVLWHKEEV